MSVKMHNLVGLLATVSLASAATAAIGQEALGVYHTSLALPPSYVWMSPDVKQAWKSGFEGKGVTVTFVDDYSSNEEFWGDWTGKWQYQRHGQFTKEEAALIAPQATFVQKDFNGYRSSVSLRSGLNVINLSYAIYAPDTYTYTGIQDWAGDNQETSIINDAIKGKAVVAKAAGNDSVAIGTAAGQGSQGGAGNIDFLDVALEGAQSAIYVGALNNNGSTGLQTMASYSNTAGSDPNVQKHFLVVGVDGDQTDLYGTSFAAPVISGYAAILGSKFKGATPTQITNQLLNTAITSTLSGYDPSIYGQGEASLSNALAPIKIK